MPVPYATITRRGVERLRAGHPWIYRSDIASAKAVPGDIVHVRSERTRPLGWALWSSTSQISLRMISSATSTTQAAGPTGPEFDDRGWLEDRLRAAIDYRKSLGTVGDVCRLVHGEADRLPALIVDKYGEYLVVQALCQGMDRRLSMVTELLVELVAPSGILARNDPKVRRLEGLEQAVEVLYGDVPEQLQLRENEVRLHVDVRQGQKTGLFLDQRENHLAAARYAHGRALDAFTYNGGFALHLAAVCDSVLALDSSESAVVATRANAALNGVSNVEAREVNVFDALRDFESKGEQFGTIVLDPPAFARNKAAVDRALSGYKEINLRALKLLEPGGHLVTCSCSYNIDEALFEAVVTQAAADARAQVALVEKRAQARDHPILLGAPETHYLKCLILRKLS
jgi:23S rRNA (cytosine1962-C5)-methyltransferase